MGGGRGDADVEHPPQNGGALVDRLAGAARRRLVAARRIEVYEDPTGPAKQPTYRRRTDYPVGTQAPVVLDGKKLGTINVSKLFA